jgi:hypothetical protein
MKFSISSSCLVPIPYVTFIVGGEMVEALTQTGVDQISVRHIFITVVNRRECIIQNSKHNYSLLEERCLHRFRIQMRRVRRFAGV